MPEAMKTLVYLGVAIVLALVAYFSYPRPADFELQTEVVNKPLFPEFSDPAKASRMKIATVNEELGEYKEFEVAKSKSTGLWAIPSESNYPADAEEQMKEAATALVNLPVIDIVTSLASEHEVYGVIEPDTSMDATQKGVGKLIAIEDRDGNDLAKVIIGSKIKGDGADKYCVRKPGEDPVYLVEIDPTKFSTKFEDWIEKDLLKLDALDVDGLTLHDYSVPNQVDLTGRVRVDIVKRMDAKVHWDRTNAKWELDELVAFRDREPFPDKLGELEELNREKLDEVKNTLADLQIVGVIRKPQGLGADLKAGDTFMEDRESQTSLVSRGFFPIDLGDGPELYSEAGEVITSTQNGVEYVLRFGRTAGVDNETDEVNRYLMVTARVDESQFEELNQDASGSATPSTEPAGTSETTETESGACGDDELLLANQEENQEQANQEKGDDGKEKKDNPLREAGKAGNEKEQSGDDQENKEQEGGDQNNKADAAAGTETPPQNQDAAKEANTESTGQDDAAAAGANPTPNANQQTPPADPITATPGADEALEKERRLNELRDKRKQAEVKVSELNYRFGDWYYIISESEYKKLRLGRQELITESAAAQDEGFNVDAFRKLETDGVQGAPPAPAGGAFPGGPGGPGGGLPPGFPGGFPGGPGQ